MLLEDGLGSEGVKPLASGDTSKDGRTRRKHEGQRAFLRCGWLSSEPECSESEFHSRNLPAGGLTLQASGIDEDNAYAVSFELLLV